MTLALVTASSVLAVLLTLGWAREFRLRRALQSLLARVFDHWRQNTHETKPDRDLPHPDATDCDRMQ